MYRVPSAQRGFLLIAAVVLIVVVGLLAAVITFLAATGVLSGAQHANSAKALFVAESGLERGIYGYKNGTWCTSLGTLTPPSTVGEGDFSLTGTFNIASIALGANITPTDTVITVASTAGFASHGRIRIENEDIDYAAITATTFTGAQRGVAGSTAAAHTTGAAVNVAQDECVIRSTGIVIAGNAKRVVEKGLQNPGAMMVYARANGDGNVYYRRWDGTNWGPERTATAVPANINFLVLKFARTRNEAVLGTLSSNGDINVQVWNGDTQTWSATTTLADAGGGGDVEFRSFDIEYETSGDRAVVVYKDANGSADPDYVIWNGANWSVATNINIPTTGEVRWIELAAHPRSSEIVMITLDSNVDVYGMRWPGGGAAGSAWNDMGVAGTWDTSAADSGEPDMSPSKVIDVAYEQLSGRAMFIWGDTTATDNYYRIWDGANLSAANILLDIPGMIDEADWVRLVPRPGSNELMYGVQDGGNPPGPGATTPDLNTAFWDGTNWTNITEHDDSTEDASHRNFDIVFETHPNNAGQAWLVWGDGATLSRRRWTGAAWVAPDTVGDDTALVQLATNPFTGALLAGIYEDSASASDDIREIHQVNGVQAWSVLSNPSTVLTDPVWAGPVVADPVLERIFIAPERYSPIVDWREIFP